MYCVTIAKLKGKEWAGFNLNSVLLLEGDCIREIESYNGKFESVEKGGLKIIETEWNDFQVLIQYRRIN